MARGAKSYLWQPVIASKSYPTKDGRGTDSYFYWALNFTACSCKSLLGEKELNHLHLIVPCSIVKGRPVLIVKEVLKGVITIEKNTSNVHVSLLSCYVNWCNLAITWNNQTGVAVQDCLHYLHMVLHACCLQWIYSVIILGINICIMP